MKSPSHIVHAHGLEFLNLLLDHIQLAHEFLDSHIHHVIRSDQCLEIISVQQVHISCEVELSLDEFELGFQSCILLSQSTILLLLDFINLAFILYLGCDAIGYFLLSVYLSLQFIYFMVLSLDFSFEKL